MSWLARLALLAVLAFTWQQWDDMKHPSKTAWARHLAEGKDPTIAEHVQVGLWYGAAARLGLVGLALVFSFAWPFSKPAPAKASIALNGSRVSPLVFWSCLGAITFMALAMRLPRMNQSFWGDEADAVASYVHGQFRPVKKSDRQGALYFEQPSWGQTFYSAKHGPNNHVLFSVTSRLCLNAWQKLTRTHATMFAEWPMRLPSLLAGLGSLAALACLLRRWGVPVAGLIAAAFMALHPWHVRYTTEARGYAFALCLLPLLLLVATNALERRDWRHWILFALLEFLAMYSWAGVAYPLAFINLALCAIMLSRSDRWMLVVRWTTASLLAAAAFISLYAPHLPQIKHYRATHLWMKGLPMDSLWLHNILVAPFTGILYYGPANADAGIVSWKSLLAISPVLTVAGFGLILLSFATGLVWLWVKRWRNAALVSGALLAAVVSALHFKFFIGDELRVWYLIFTLPFVAICVAMGLVWISGLARFVPRFRAALAAVPLCLMAAALWPMNQKLMTRAPEGFKDVMALTRDRHELFNPKGRAEVLMCWLWRYSALYDPRGEIHVRDEPSLRRCMKDAAGSMEGFFVVVGYRLLAEAQNADMLRVLENPALFEKVAVIPGYETIQSLEVYRMKLAPTP